MHGGCRTRRRRQRLFGGLQHIFRPAPFSKRPGFCQISFVASLNSEKKASNPKSPMITKLAISNYRSVLDLVMPLRRLYVVTGPNGSGKSNLYRALRLLAEPAHDGVISALAREGGLHSTVWAGPEDLSRAMRAGKVQIQGSSRKRALRLQLGFSGDDLGYSISLGLPKPDDSDEPSAFTLDPEIKHEAIWAGPQIRPSTLLIERKESVVRARADRDWTIAAKNINSYDSIFSQLADPNATPEVFWLRERIR